MPNTYKCKILPSYSTGCYKSDRKARIHKEKNYRSNYKKMKTVH